MKVPFYGQGMNCGFEDCVVFFELLDQYGFDQLETVLKKYSEIRVPDAHAICDLAEANYLEMAYLVTTIGYRFRKKLDGWLNAILGSKWEPLYTMVTFTRTRYSEVVKKRKNQDETIASVRQILVTLFLGTAAITGFKILKNYIK